MLENQQALELWDEDYSWPLRVLISQAYPNGSGRETAVNLTNSGSPWLGAWLDHDRFWLQEQFNHITREPTYAGYYRDYTMVLRSLRRAKFLLYLWNREVSRWWDLHPQNVGATH